MMRKFTLPLLILIFFLGFIFVTTIQAGGVDPTLANLPTAYPTGPWVGADASGPWTPTPNFQSTPVPIQATPTLQQAGGFPQVEPIVHIKFDENGGTILDSATNRSGFLAGTFWRVPGQFGNALFLQGRENSAGTFYNHPTLALEGHEFTLSWWVKLDDVNGNIDLLKRDYTSYFRCDGGHRGPAFCAEAIISEWGIFGRAKADYVSFRIIRSSYLYYEEANLLADSRWHMITVTGIPEVEGGVRLYLDGQLVDVAAGKLSIDERIDSIKPLTFSSPFNQSSGGAIDDFRIYNQALSATEVGDLYRGE